jgi:hypothetical protein
MSGDLYERLSSLIERIGFQKSRESFACFTFTLDCVFACELLQLIMTLCDVRSIASIDQNRTKLRAVPCRDSADAGAGTLS